MKNNKLISVNFKHPTKDIKNTYFGIRFLKNNQVVVFYQDKSPDRLVLAGEKFTMEEMEYKVRYQTDFLNGRPLAKNIWEDMKEAESFEEEDSRPTKIDF